MEQKFDDFNFVITEINVAHKWLFHPLSVYDCSIDRNSYGLIYILTGELDYCFSDGKKIKVKAGDIFLLKPTHSYKVTCSSECLHYTVNFQIMPASIEGEMANKVLTNNNIPIINQNTSINAQTDSFEKICEIWSKKEHGYRTLAVSLTYKLLYDFILKQQILYRNDEYLKIVPAINILEKDWDKEITLISLANACNLSVSHFRHIFTQIFKVSPMEYKNSLRLLYAKDYLMREGFSIKQIAYKCGFYDANYFSRFFKKHTGVSPNKFYHS